MNKLATVPQNSEGFMSAFVEAKNKNFFQKEVGTQKMFIICAVKTVTGLEAWARGLQIDTETGEVVKRDGKEIELSKPIVYRSKGGYKTHPMIEELKRNTVNPSFDRAKNGGIEEKSFFAFLAYNFTKKQVQVCKFTSGSAQALYTMFSKRDADDFQTNFLSIECKETDKVFMGKKTIEVTFDFIGIKKDATELKSSLEVAAKDLVERSIATETDGVFSISYNLLDALFEGKDPLEAEFEDPFKS